MADIIQPSNDARATALAVAVRLVRYADFDDKGNTPRGEELAKQRAKLIGELAGQLLNAIKSSTEA